MKSIYKKDMEFSSKKTSEEDQIAKEDKHRDGEEIMEVSVINTAGKTSAENGTAVKVCLFIMIDQHHGDLFVIIEHIRVPDISLRDTNLLHKTSLPASFRVYGSDCSRSILSVSSHHEVATKYFATHSNGDMTAGCYFLNDRFKVLLLYGF